MIRRFLICALIAGALPAAAQSRAPYAGRPIVDVIGEMQERGLRIVYSTDLVRASMRVIAEPRATTDRAILEEILAPHNLAVREAGGVLSIVRAPKKEIALPPRKPVDATGGPPAPVALASIVVTASNYSILGGAPEHRETLNRQEINRSAHLADDLFRALGQLPGATSTDFSAAFGVRGGLPEEVAVVIDGLQVAAPFHVKYFQNALSIIDSDAVGGLDYLSGGFPVEYGGAMSGVIDMSTASPQQHRHTYAGISFSHARVVSDGTFADDRGEWLLSLRRGYFDIILGLFYEDIAVRPGYGDVIGKVQYRIGDRSILSGDVLAAVDHVDYHRGGDTIHAGYDNIYTWLNLRTAWSPRLSSQSVVSLARSREKRDGGLETVSEAGEVTDRRAFDVAGFKQDWMIDRSDIRHYAKFGVDVKRYTTRYDYTSHAITREPMLRFTGLPVERSLATSIDPSGNSAAFYAADRLRVAPWFIVEGGVRYERESWNAADAEWTPRLNAVFILGESTALRASAGVFRQAPRLDEIDVEDGQLTPYRAQRSRQGEIGIEHRFGAGIMARATAYRKDIDRVRPRYENLFDRDEFFPEVKYDRVRIEPKSAEAHGLELFVKDDSARAFTWWLSMARSRAVDHFRDGTEVLRSWDQPTAVSFNLNYRQGDRWNFNVAGLLHPGWPLTKLLAAYVPGPGGTFSIAPSIGPRNTIRYPTYRRFDARVMHTSALSKGTFRSWLELTNVLNRENSCCTDGFSFNVDPSRRTVAVTPNQNGLGWLPSFGIAWEF